MDESQRRKMEGNRGSEGPSEGHRKDPMKESEWQCERCVNDEMMSVELSSLTNSDKMFR